MATAKNDTTRKSTNASTATTKRLTSGSAVPPQAAKKDAAVAVNNKQTTALATVNFEEDAGGFTNMDSSDLAIPRIALLQGNSPQVDKAKKGEGKFIEGAEAGDFINSVENTVAFSGEDGFYLIPVVGRKTFIEWVPKSKGGGFVADHGPDEAILQTCEKDEETGGWFNSKGNEMVLTYEYHACVLDSEKENPRQAVISLSKSGIKVAKRLNTMIQNLIRKSPASGRPFNPAPFYSYFHVTSLPQTNRNGQSYFGWNVTRSGDVVEELKNGAELYNECKMFREAIGQGKVKVADRTSDVEATTESDDSAL